MQILKKKAEEERIAFANRLAHQKVKAEQIKEALLDELRQSQLKTGKFAKARATYENEQYSSRISKITELHKEISLLEKEIEKMPNPQNFIDSMPLVFAVVEITDMLREIKRLQEEIKKLTGGKAKRKTNKKKARKNRKTSKKR
jgi:uncharacterized small protein (DUF1192 family)